MKKTAFKIFAIIALGSVVAYTGCKKEDKKPDTNAARDNAAADNAFAGIWKQISTVTDSSGTLRGDTYPTIAACATGTITPWDLTTWPKTLTIDFGTSNCLGNDGVYRRGVVTAVFTGPYQDSASVITITTSNYYHNDYKVDGVQTITNMGTNAAGHPVFNVVVNNAVITHPNNGGTSTWNTNQNREFFAGYNTPLNIFDDVYLITGTANGVSTGGSAYSIVTNSALRVNVGCRWIVSGAFTLTLNDYPNYPIVFDYGTGGCDALATATLNNVVYNIVMN